MYGREIIFSPVCPYLPKKKTSLLAYGDGGTSQTAPQGALTNLLTSGKLNSYLADIDAQAEDMFLRLVEQIANREGVTEQLKAENQMEWVGRINNIRSRAMEIVNDELIYT